MTTPLDSVTTCSADTIVRMTGVGGIENLEVTRIPSERPAPGMVRVRHIAVGVNFIDIYHRIGLYPLALPAIIGVEAAGVVEAFGEGLDATCRRLRTTAICLALDSASHADGRSLSAHTPRKTPCNAGG